MCSSSKELIAFLGGPLKSPSMGMRVELGPSFQKIPPLCRMWWCMPVISSLRRLRQENHNLRPA
jgi:hypothetical protein